MTIGMIIFAFAIILILPVAVSPLALLGYWSPKSRYRILYCVLLAMVFGIAGYCFKDPSTNPDIVRYIQILQQYRGRNLFDSFNLAYSNLFAVDIYFHVVSELGDDQMLPAISCFIYYFVAFYIMQDYKSRVTIKNIDYIIFTTFVTCATIFCSIVNGIRWPLSFVLFILAVYREIVQGKKNFWTWVLYAISIFFHFSAIVLLIIRLLLFVKNKKIMLTVGALGALVPGAINMLSKRIGGLTTSNTIINQLLYSLNRSNMYFQWNQGEWADIVRNSRYYKLEAFFYYIIVGILLFCFYYLYKKRKKNGITQNYFAIEDVFTFFLLIATLISFTMSAHTYIRFVTPLILCFTLVIYKFYQECISSWIRIAVNTMFILLSGVGLLLNLYIIRTMIDLPEYIADIATFGIFKLFLKY